MWTSVHRIRQVVISMQTAPTHLGRLSVPVRKAIQEMERRPAQVRMCVCVCVCVYVCVPKICTNWSVFCLGL